VKLFSHLSRITTPGRKFVPQIDGLRFVAILSVIAYHVWQIGLFHLAKAAPAEAVSGGPVNDMFRTGHFGVELFFTVSGFILALPFAQQILSGGERVSLRDYYWRRLTRIEPPYVISLLIAFVLCALVFRRMPNHGLLYHGAGWADYSLAHIGASLAYVNAFVFGTHPYPNNVLWSLEVEVQFYLLAPWLVTIFFVRTAWWRRFLIAGTIALFPCLWGWIGVQTYWAIFSLPGNIQYFLAGFLLADFYLAGGLAKARDFKWDGIFLFAGAATVVIQNHAVWRFLMPWLILAACVAAFRGKIMARLLGNRWLTTIGGMCYTIYLYHWFMISGLYRATIVLQTKILWLDLLIQFAVMAPIIIVVCTGMFVLFERPFMRRDWPQKLWGKIRRPKHARL
jgi:peptidoglycan/LPS O-acetylase OafA/YrhL